MKNNKIKIRIRYNICQSYGYTFDAKMILEKVRKRKAL